MDNLFNNYFNIDKKTSCKSYNNFKNCKTDSHSDIKYTIKSESKLDKILVDTNLNK